MIVQLSQWIVGHSTEVTTFMLVLGRAGGLIAGAPFWGSRMLPLPVRIWIALLLAIATFPLVQNVVLPGGITLLSVTLALVREAFLGLALG